MANQDKSMNSSQPDATGDSPSLSRVQDRRSYVLESIGAVSVIGFFVGIYFAYQTQVSGVVTQSEFDLLQPGQSVAVVNELLGFEGTVVKPKSGEDVDSQPTASSSVATTYVWQNSTISFVQCTFIDGRLTDKTATDLP